MKSILAITLLVTMMLMSCSDKAKEKTDWDLFRLNGRVKAIKEISYHATEELGEAVKKGPGGKEQHNTYLLFNREGLRLEENRYYHDGSVFLKQTYTRNSKNNIAEIMQTFGSIGDTERLVFEYNKNGSVRKLSIYDKALGSLKEKQEYTYNDSGRLAENNVHYTTSSYTNRRIQYTYDDNGNLTKLTIYNHSNEPTSTRAYKYDSQNNITELYCKDYDTNAENRYVYLYGSDKLAAKEHKYDADGVLEESWAYEYNIDSRNNWTMRRDYRDGCLVYIVEREIEYF